MVGLLPLKEAIGVRIPGPQQSINITCFGCFCHDAIRTSVAYLSDISVFHGKVPKYLWSYDTLPNYLNNLKEQGVIISNGYDEITDLEISEAVRVFKGSNFNEVMNWLDVDSLSKLFEILRGVINAMKGSPEEIQTATLQVLDFMNTNQLAQFASQMLPAVKVKIKKK